MKKSLRYALVILCLAGISLGSAFVGAKVGFEIARKKFRQRSNPEVWHQQAMRVLEDRLQLEGDQLGKIQSLVDGAVEQLKATRRETLSESGAVVDELFDAVDAELNPRQQVVFRELIKDRAKLKREIIEDNSVQRDGEQVNTSANTTNSEVNAIRKETDR